MIEILWHGRGGQGAFTASKLLGAAYTIKDNESFALAFPSFGPERRGAPIRAFTKLDQKPIGNRSETALADYSVFLDDTLFSERSLSELKDGGKIILNTKQNIESDKVMTFDGSSLAQEILRMPVVNTIMLGVLSAVSGIVSADNIIDAIRLYMPPKLHEKNAAAVEKAVKGALT